MSRDPYLLFPTCTNPRTILGNRFHPRSHRQSYQFYPLSAVGHSTWHWAGERVSWYPDAQVRHHRYSRATDVFPRISTPPMACPTRQLLRTAADSAMKQRYNSSPGWHSRQQGDHIKFDRLPRHICFLYSQHSTQQVTKAGASVPDLTIQSVLITAFRPCRERGISIRHRLP